MRHAIGPVVRRRLLVPGALLALSGCGAEPVTPAFQVRDSAGVRIVESHRPAWEDDGWTVGAQALLRLGVMEGEAALQFEGVTGMARLEDGTLVVADGGAQEVRFFDATGTLLGVSGGKGEGPGEFSGLSALGVGGDGSIWAYDFLLRRITWLGPRGELLRTVTVGPEPPMLNPVGALPDGTFLLKQLWAATAVAQASESGLRRDPVAFVRFDPDGVLVDTLGLFPGREVYLTEEEGRGVMGTPLFGHNAVGAPWEEGVAVGTQESFQVVRYSPEGEVILIARIPGWSTALAPEDLEEAVEARLATVPEEARSEARRNIESMPVSDAKPAYGGLLADEVGNLWVAEWAPYPSTPEHWTVLDSGGRWLGEIFLPPRFFPYAAGRDWVLGVERDELDVEYVALYPVRQNPAATRSTPSTTRSTSSSVVYRAIPARTMPSSS